MLTFEFTGVEGRMTESEILTSGMAGKQVQIRFDSSWTSLSKTVVFRAGEVCRTADISASPITIPDAVLARPFCRLYVGVYGTDEAGTVIIPTLMAEGPMIRYGADPTEDSTAEELPVWKKLQDQIGDLTALETDCRENLVAAVNEIHRQLRKDPDCVGFSVEAVVLLTNILRHAVYDTDQSDAIDALAEELGISSGDSEGGGEQPGIPEDPDVPEAVLTGLAVSYTGGDVPVGTHLMELTGVTVYAQYSNGFSEPVVGYSLTGYIAAGSNRIQVTYRNISTYFTVTGIPAGEEEPEVTLTGITAAYSGGDVAAGTALTDLTGITVTARYSDGSEASVTGYSLSGTIAVGTNTVTVSYEGHTATFAVTGIQESAEGPLLLHEWDYTQSLVDSVGGVEMVLTGATRDEMGLHINTVNDAACTTVNLLGKTAEIELGEITDGFSSGHGRAITLSAWVGVDSLGYNSGIIWRSTGRWCWYGGATVAGWTDGENTNKLALSNGIIRIPLKENKEKFDVTLNGDVLLSQVDRNGTSYLGFGSDKTAFAGLTVKKLRIYEGA